jgi:phospholipase/carboxylesterase
MNRELVILLHGVGSSGADLAPLGNTWRDTLPGVDFVTPDAPFSFGHGPGRQWFSIDGVTEANRPERVAAARAAFDKALSSIIAAHGLSDRLDRVALVGFSQGSIMALDALASGRWPVAAIVAFSGRLASPRPLTPSPGTRALLIHGDADAVMPVAESTRAAATLREMGTDTGLHVLSGVGHGISPEGVAFAGAFLAETFAQAKGDA